MSNIYVEETKIDNIIVKVIVIFIYILNNFNI